MTAQLLAVLIEVTSVGAAGQQLRKPISGLAKTLIPKPSTPQRSSGTSAQQQRSEAIRRGIGVLASTARQVRA